MRLLMRSGQEKNAFYPRLFVVNVILSARNTPMQDIEGMDNITAAHILQAREAMHG
jgi:hypothetical protein